MSIYSAAIFQYFRRPTREVKVGDIGIGGSNPIRVQSMTISDTNDTAAVVAETRTLVAAGCEIVRITAPTIHHAENLGEIKKQLRAEGITVPLVADIHFTPQAAMIAADHVEKVRINPGNYADRKLFAVKEYTDQEYESELQRMAEKFIPLVQKCQANGVAMRIGTNHGSLSDRIMNRFGDTPEGMVESALEFIRICESEGYHDLVLSMKASSPFTMIVAYRLLAQRMNELKMDYPFHLGVTEAGEGEDGRIKSAIGIGSLLEDGIGDTVRVSLTEDSIHEIPVAQQLVKKFNQLAVQSQPKQEPDVPWNPIVRERRISELIRGKNDFSLGEKQSYTVSNVWEFSQQSLEGLIEKLRLTQETEDRGDILFISGASIEEFSKVKTRLHEACPDLLVGWVSNDEAEIKTALNIADAILILLSPTTAAGDIVEWGRRAAEHQVVLDIRFSSVAMVSEYAEILRSLPPVLISLTTNRPIHEYRKLAKVLIKEKIGHAINLSLQATSLSEPSLETASVLGGLLVDGIGDAVQLTGLDFSASTTLAFNILQASRLRITKAEFIACPSCGRTLFDLQDTTQRIKEKTAHLKGVKIAIMGCIVNGPGEMADADFGYVGAGPGKIHLYVGKECVEKNISSEIADEKLIELIKSHGRWVEPLAEKVV